jgi:hypothetical protein
MRGSTSGRVHRLAVGAPLSGRSRAAHGLDLGEAVELARVLGRLPARLVLYAVEVVEVGFGRGLTTAVAAAGDLLATHIAAEVTADHRHRGAPATTRQDPSQLVGLVRRQPGDREVELNQQPVADVDRSTGGGDQAQPHAGGGPVVRRWPSRPAGR